MIVLAAVANALDSKSKSMIRPGGWNFRSKNYFFLMFWGTDGIHQPRKTLGGSWVGLEWRECLGGVGETGSNLGHFNDPKGGRPIRM